MKSGKIGIFVLIAAVLFTSCSIDESSYDTTINGEYDNDSNIVTTEQDESQADEETADLFPSQIQGVYSRDVLERMYYNSCDIVIEEDSILVHYQGDVYQFDADDVSELSYAEPNTYLYEIYDEENDIMGHINVELYADCKAGARICRISNPEQLLVADCVGFYTKTPYGIPLENYDNLDEKDHDLIKNTILLEKMFQYGCFPVQQDKVSVEVQGTALNPLVCTYWHYDSTAYCFSYDIEKYEENKIHVFSKSCSGEYENVFAIGTIELVDNTFYVDIDFYRDCEGINIDNCTEYPITSNINTTTEYVSLY